MVTFKIKIGDGVKVSFRSSVDASVNDYDLNSYIRFSTYNEGVVGVREHDYENLSHVFACDSFDTVKDRCIAKGIKATDSVIYGVISHQFTPLFKELFIDVLTEFKFKLSDQDDGFGFRYEAYGIDTVEKPAFVEKVVNRMLEVANEVLNDEAVFDSCLEEIQAVMQKRQVVKTARSSRFAPEANEYTVWYDHRNGFMDCDRRSTKVTSLSEITPKKASWVPFKAQSAEIGYWREDKEATITANKVEADKLTAAGIANALIDDVDYRFIYIPVIKVKAEGISQKISLVWSVTENTWINLAAAKKDSKAKIGAYQSGSCLSLDELRDENATIFC